MESSLQKFDKLLLLKTTNLKNNLHLHLLLLQEKYSLQFLQTNIVLHLPLLQVLDNQFESNHQLFLMIWLMFSSYRLQNFVLSLLKSKMNLQEINCKFSLQNRKMRKLLALILWLFRNQLTPYASFHLVRCCLVLNLYGLNFQFLGSIRY